MGCGINIQKTIPAGCQGSTNLSNFGTRNTQVSLLRTRFMWTMSVIDRSNILIIIRNEGNFSEVIPATFNKKGYRESSQILSIWTGEILRSSAFATSMSISCCIIARRPPAARTCISLSRFNIEFNCAKYHVRTKSAALEDGFTLHSRSELKLLVAIVKSRRNGSEV